VQFRRAKRGGGSFTETDANDRKRRHVVKPGGKKGTGVGAIPQRIKGKEKRKLPGRGGGEMSQTSETP